MKKMLAVSCCIALMLSLAGFTAQADAYHYYGYGYYEDDLALYDDFSGKGIDPDKWSGRSTINSPSPSITNDRRELVARDSMAERGREVRWGKLIMHGRSFGNTYNDETRRTFYREQLRINDPPASSITAIKVSLKVLKASAAACPANTEVTQARFRVVGFFFNTGPGSDPGGVNYDGRVFAIINITRRSDSADPPDVLTVSGSVTHRIQSFPTVIQTGLGGASLGTVKLGEKIKVLLKWDPDNDRFVFQRDFEPEVDVLYSVPDDRPVFGATKRVEVFHITPNCVGEPLSEASIKVAVDKVWVNKSALE